MDDKSPGAGNTLITSYAPARTSGRGLRTCGIISALARQGPVTVAYVPFEGETPAADLIRDERVTLHPITPTRGPSRLYAALRASMRGAPWGLAKTATPQAVAAALSAGPHERVIADGPTMATALLGVARHRPVIYLAHNVESSFRGTSVLRRFERRILRTFAESWMVSKADIGYARELAGPAIKTRYVPNVVDVAALEPHPRRSDRKQILFLADFTYPPNRGGLAFLLDEVMPLVWRRQPQANLLVVGRGAQRTSSDSRVRIVGFAEDLESVYREVDCAAVPLLRGGGSPLKFIEAMAHGLPVVATRRAATGLQALPDVHFREADGAEAFASALVEVLGDESDELGARARELVQHSYSIEALAAILTRER